MQKERYAKLTLVLSLIAAALALSAALIEYVRERKVNVGLIAASIFLVALGFGARSRIAQSK